MEGIEFLEDDVISLLETKGIHTIEDLGDYIGEDNLVLELQFLVKNRLEKLKNKLNKVKSKPVLTEASRRVTIEDQISTGTKNSVNKTLKQIKQDFEQNTIEKEHSVISGNNFRLKENTLNAIADLCKKYQSRSTENNSKTLLECVLNVIIQDVVQIDSEFDDMDLSIIFQETAELSGIPSSVGFIYSLENIDNHWGKKKGIQSTILDKHLQQLQVTVEGFVYNELFSRLLERKISRGKQRRRV
ncbi:MAG: hypothetical protein GPJ54_14610 [Candidatus Heimdallarchaeota archaeon]|nr:hypothetical protein [Candidatus Heimdallarchaeota archaeon]